MTARSWHAAEPRLGMSVDELIHALAALATDEAENGKVHVTVRTNGSGGIKQLTGRPAK